MKVSNYETLEAARVKYLQRVDDEANRIRARHITSGPGQESSYERKEKHARAFQAGEPGPHHWVEAEAAVTGVPVAQVVARIVVQADLWDHHAALLEAQRIGAKKKVREATTVRAMYEALDDGAIEMQNISAALAALDV